MPRGSGTVEVVDMSVRSSVPCGHPANPLLAALSSLHGDPWPSRCELPAVRACWGSVCRFGVSYGPVRFDLAWLLGCCTRPQVRRVTPNYGDRLA